MTRWLVSLLQAAVLGAALATGVHAAPAAGFDGSWAGVIRWANRTNAVQLDLASDSTGAAHGSLDLFGDETSVWLPGVRIEGDSLVASYASRLTGSTAVACVRQGDMLRGVASRAGQAGTVELRRLAPFDTAAARAEEGIYAAGRDTFIVNRVTPTLLAISEPPAHALRILFPAGTNEYVAGPTLFAAVPERWRLRFRDERSDAARFVIARNGREEVAHRIPLHVEEVSFRNDTLTFAGAFIRPRAPGRYPVVVHLHGSGNSIRTSHLGIAYYLAVHGIASLIFDKRGSGGSRGVYPTATFDDLAADAAAGATSLLSRPDVDTLHIGFAGISEGATTCMVAAARFRRTAFAIPISGGVLPASDWEQYEAADQLTSDGSFSTADTAKAMNFLRRRDVYAGTGTHWDEYAAAIQDANAPDARWYDYPTTDLFGWAKPDSHGWDLKRLRYFYDPAVATRTLTCPVLGVFGEFDVPAAVAIEVPLMKRNLLRATDVTVTVIPNANHNLFLVHSGNVHEMDSVSHYAPELFPLITGWLTRHTLRPPAEDPTARR